MSDGRSGKRSRGTGTAELLAKTGEPYTRTGAWDEVRSQLEGGCVLTKVVLDKPKGKSAYTFHFKDARGNRIYVKLQIGSGTVFGRSFHIG